uniref:Uncharacterized protein n=1 Tax=Laccaria bicolor TaxID=29883 RepID=Q96UR8_LACBI|nr:unknown [Laccaria bicolor]
MMHHHHLLLHLQNQLKESAAPVDCSKGFISGVQEKIRTPGMMHHHHLLLHLQNQLKESAAPVETVPTVTTDLLGLDEISPDPSSLKEKNAMALAIVPTTDNSSNGTSNSALDIPNGATGWELALVTTSSSNSSVQAESKLAGGLDKLTLDSLYEDCDDSRYLAAIQGQVAPNPFEASPIDATGDMTLFYAFTKGCSTIRCTDGFYGSAATSFICAATDDWGIKFLPTRFGKSIYSVHIRYAAGDSVIRLNFPVWNCRLHARCCQSESFFWEIKAKSRDVHKVAQLDCWTVRYFTTSTSLFMSYLFPLLVQPSVFLYYMTPRHEWSCHESVRGTHLFCDALRSYCCLICCYQGCIIFHVVTSLFRFNLSIR